MSASRHSFSEESATHRCPHPDNLPTDVPDRTILLLSFLHGCIVDKKKTPRFCGSDVPLNVLTNVVYPDRGYTPLQDTDGCFYKDSDVFRIRRSSIFYKQK
jgi:hypothetical protein